MADAVCGPSNALQSFQKHSQVDRTLQQDRITSRRTPTEAFRSRGANAGVLDQEFEAFQAQSGAGFADAHLGHISQNQGFRPPVPHNIAHDPAASWSTDFQRLRLGENAHAPARTLPQGPAATAGWHQDFFRSQSSSPFQASQPSHQLNQPTAAFSTFQPNYMNSSFAMQQPFSMAPMSSQMDMSDVARGKMRETENFAIDQAALEHEFEAYAAEMDRQALAKEEAIATAEETSRTDDAMDDLKAQARFMNAISDEDLRTRFQRDAQKAGASAHVHFRSEDIAASEEGPVFFADNERFTGPLPTEQIPQEPSEQPAPARDDDQLAQTASELLDRVADNHSEKFQNSSFLSLMRQLRDREVQVRGDKMVPADGSGNSTRIPATQQDEDLGRDMKMAGALHPPDATGEDSRRRPVS